MKIHATIRNEIPLMKEVPTTGSYSGVDVSFLLMVHTTERK